MNRRRFLSQTTAASAAALLSSRLHADPARTPMPKGKADHCIFIWLGGGMSQIDTFDPKTRGNPKSKPSVAGSDYAAIDTAVPGVCFTEHLAQSARLADRITAVRTVNHRLGIEHALATNFVHTGRAVSGSTIYPSIGSVVAHERGAARGDDARARLADCDGGGGGGGVSCGSRRTRLRAPTTHPSSSPHSGWPR